MRQAVLIRRKPWRRGAKAGKEPAATDVQSPRSIASAPKRAPAKHLAGVMSEICHLLSGGRQLMTAQKARVCRNRAISRAKRSEWALPLLVNRRKSSASVAETCLRRDKRSAAGSSTAMLGDEMDDMSHDGSRHTRFGRKGLIRAGCYFSAPVQGLSPDACRRPTIVPVGA